VNSKEENSEDFRPNYVQEFDLCAVLLFPEISIFLSFSSASVILSPVLYFLYCLVLNKNLGIFLMSDQTKFSKHRTKCTNSYYILENLRFNKQFFVSFSSNSFAQSTFSHVCKYFPDKLANFSIVNATPAVLMKKENDF
jgi:hypothetical protein